MEFLNLTTNELEVVYDDISSYDLTSGQQELYNVLLQWNMDNLFIQLKGNF